MRYPTGPFGGQTQLHIGGFTTSRRGFIGGAAMMAGAVFLPASLRAEEGPKQGGRLRYVSMTARNRIRWNRAAGPR